MKPLAVRVGITFKDDVCTPLLVPPKHICRRACGLWIGACLSRGGGGGLPAHAGSHVRSRTGCRTSFAAMAVAPGVLEGLPSEPFRSSPGSRVFG